jgi:hypothetical protein
VRTLAERPNQKPWGGFESKARKANEGRSDPPFQFFRHRSKGKKQKLRAKPLRFLRYLLFKNLN